ncbi:MAG: transposase [Thermoguttaceae bacterium]|nr:transposase [Thermoguttaceae bacterium]
MDPEKIFVRSAIGIDVGKDLCVACSLPEKKFFTFRNESKAIQKFVDDVKLHIRPDQIILEPTSRYERPLARALQEAEQHVVVMNPRRLKYLADAEGRTYKSDPNDAFYFAKVAMRGVWRVGHGRNGLKTALYCAVASAMRFDPPIRAFSERLKARGSSGLRLKIACMRKRIVQAHALLKKDELCQCPTGI